MWNALLKILSTWYFKYELITCLYVFEPWEKKFMNGIIIAIICLVSYSSYVYLPHYAMTLFDYINDGKSTERSLIVDFSRCPTSRI